MRDIKIFIDYLNVVLLKYDGKKKTSFFGIKFLYISVEEWK